MMLYKIFLLCNLSVASCILYADPDFLFLDEDWPKEKPLSVTICADSLDDIRILSGNDKNRFSLLPINSTCGGLKLEKDLDADLLHSDGTRWQSFSLLFEDSKNHERASLDIQVVDVNDCVPVFMNVPSEIKVSEKLSVGSVIQTIKAFDPDTGVGGIVKFFIDGLKFAVANEKCVNSECSADLVLKLPLDFESNPVEHLKIIARDGASLTKHANERATNLTVNIIDEQDTPPNFVATLTQPLRVAEDLPVGSKIFQAVAEDGDRHAPKKNEIYYEIGENENFDIDPFSGWITVKKPLDRETTASFSLNIIATEQDANRMSSEMSIKVQVEDSDDNAPRCSTNQYTAKIDRKTRKFELETPITVLDMDQGKNAQFDASLAGEFSESFKILPSKIQGSADIMVKVVDFESLEYVTDKEILLELKLTPRNTENSEIGKCLLIVRIDGESKPKKIPKTFAFSKKHYEIKLKENSMPSVLANLTNSLAKDVVFSLEGDGAQYFAVNETAQLVSVKPIDAETFRRIHLKISAERNGVATTSEGDIEILDENDNAPVFEKHFYQFNVTEETEATFHVKAIDVDDGKNSELTYKIVNGSVDGISVNPKDGRIFVSKFDAEKMDWLVRNITIQASDSGSPPLSNTTIVRILIKDVNDNAPFFSRTMYNAILNCSTPKNHTVLTVKAIDLDVSGSKIAYELPGEMGKYFKIGRNSGHIRLVENLPETRDVFHFNVIARDSGDPPKQSTSRVSVSREECLQSTSSPTTMANKKSTEISEKDKSTENLSPKHYQAELSENAPIGTKVLQIDLKTAKLSKDTKLNLVLQNETRKLLEVEKSGQIIVAQNIDFEEVEVINGSVFARSGKRNLLVATISVFVKDLDDHSPVFRLPPAHHIELPSTIHVGHILDLPYPLAEDYDASEVFSKIEYTFVNQSKFFKIDRNTSIVQLVKSLKSAPKQMNLTIRASGLSNVTKYATTNITISIISTPNQTNVSATPTPGLFEKIPSELSVFEGEPLGTVLLTLPIVDAKTMSGITLKNSEFFELSTSGDLKLRKSLRGHANEKHCFQLEAKLDSKSIAKNLCFIIKARIKGPIVYWPTQNSLLKFKENTKYETLLTINASSNLLDPKHNKLKYGIMEMKNEDWKEFTIDSRGVLRAKNLFDFERKERYGLQVQVCDFTDQCALSSFTIEIEDLNDMCPVFLNTTEEFSVVENQVVNSTGLLVGEFEKAIDHDGTVEKRSICYRVEDENSLYFIPDPHVPKLFVRTSLDREAQAEYNVSVLTYDCHLKERDLSCQNSSQNQSESTKIIQVLVLDVNDNFPKFLEKEYYGKILERRTQFDDVVLQTVAIDPDDEKDGLRYAIASVIRTDKETIPKEDAPFLMNSTTGELISRVVYTADMPHSYSFNVVVRDEVGHEDEASVTITVLNYIEQMELVFNLDENSIKSNLQEITRLMFEATTLYFVPDSISGQSNSTTMIGHFLERDKHLAPANKARMLFEETRSEQAQKARNTLRRRYALQEMVSNTSIQDPSGANSFLSGNMDFVILAIGCVFCVLFMVFLMLLFYLCCHRRSKSGKMSGFSGTTRTTISLIFADSLIHPGIPTPKRTAVAQHRISSPKLISHDELPISRPVKIFESLQSTEL